jgi:hypothetical protein
MENARRSRPLQQQLLREIGQLSDELRELRRKDASGSRPRIAALEVALREKWQELRTLRAGSTDPGG